ncbi:MAG: DIP1984 family protein [Synechococcales cyanobacterium]
MKLAEALMLRADAQKKAEQLRQRLSRSAKVQEGEHPPEDPNVLMREVEAVVQELTRLIQVINRTNSHTVFREAQTLTDALAQRDMLALRRSIYASLLDAAAGQQTRYSRSEIKLVTTVDVASLQRQVDHLAQAYRQLDARIQEMNWAVEVLNP